MKRLLGLVALLLATCALAAGGPLAVAARQATPAASPLASLGLPELQITATDQGYDAPADVAAGWYLVTLDNQTSEPDSELTCDILLLPSGESVDSVLAIVATPPPLATGPPPAWFYQTTWAGGPVAATGQSAQAVVHLTEGSWLIWNGGQTMPAPTTLKVTAATGAVTTPAPAADVNVSMQEYTILGLEQPVPAGERVWKITNTGTQPHFMEMAKLPDGTTQQQLAAYLTGELTGTPVAGAMNGEEAIPVSGGISTLSPGQTMWSAVDLAPGTYGVACFFPDIQSGTPHALLGMSVVFTVQ
jgi:hypothetical protein